MIEGRGCPTGIATKLKETPRNMEISQLKREVETVGSRLGTTQDYL